MNKATKMQLIAKKTLKPLAVFSFQELSVPVIDTVNHHYQDTGIHFFVAASVEKVNSVQVLVYNF